jgi:hypothetical protein
VDGTTEETAPPLREPGGHGRSRGLRLSTRLLAIALASTIVVPAAAWLLDFHGLALGLIALTAIAATLGANRLYSPRIDRWLQGAKGERDVAAVLSRLEGDGWRALHGVSLGRGDVDHVLVGPGGIYTIETKSSRGQIGVDRIRPAMLKQAYAEKKLLERITGLDVEPLLVFSQAWLVGSVPARRRGVTIVPARMLQHYISRRRPTLQPERAKRIYEQLVVALADAS